VTIGGFWKVGSTLLDLECRQEIVKLAFRGI